MAEGLTGSSRPGGSSKRRTSWRPVRFGPMAQDLGPIVEHTAREALTKAKSKEVEAAIDALLSAASPIGESLPSDEHVLFAAWALLRELSGQRFGVVVSVTRAVLLLTHRQLVMVPYGRKAPAAIAVSLRTLSRVHVDENPAGSETLIEAGSTRLRVAGHTGPYHELIERLQSGSWNADEGSRLDPFATTERICALGPLVLYEDRLLTPERVFPLSGEVGAEVQTAGDFAATRGRNLAAGAAGTALLGPVGMLFGAAQTKIHDLRELFLLVEGPDWAYGINFQPAYGLEVRQFAQQLNLAARKRGHRQQDAPGEDDRLQRLKRLGELKDGGVLTKDEFLAEKARILDGR